MPLTKCVRCDKLFNKTEEPVCGECRPDEHADYETIRAHLQDNPGLSAEKVAEGTGINIKCVMRLVDTGVITSMEISAGGITCGQCGAPAISLSKRLCQSCLDKLNVKMIHAQQSIRKTQENAGPHGNRVRDILDDKRR
jgi:hypothetical protein